MKTLELNQKENKLFLNGKEINQENISRAKFRYDEIDIILGFAKELRKIEGVDTGCLGCKR